MPLTLLTHRRQHHASRRATAAAFAVVLALLACGKAPSEKEIAQKGAERRVLVQRAASALAEVRDAFVKVPQEPVRCPDARLAELEAKYGEKARTLFVVQWHYLDRYTTAAVQPNVMSNPYHVITSAMILNMPAPGELPAGDTDSVVWKLKDPAWRAEKMLERPLIAVFRGTHEDPPKLEESFQGHGDWRGWVGVFDFESKKYLCFIDFTQDRDVEDLKISRAEEEAALQDDREAFTKAAADSLARKLVEEAQQSLRTETGRSLRLER